MKILHTSDLHLGKLLYGVSLINEQKSFIDNFLFKVIEEEAPDVILISGDIYDRSIAPPQAIELFESILLTVGLKYKIPLLAISGNHDSPERIAPAAELMKKSNIFICTKLKDSLTPYIYEKDGTSYYFWMLPHFEPAQLRQELSDDSVRGFNDAYKKILDMIRSRFTGNSVNILLAHCFVTGCTVSESESPIYVGTSGEISAELFEGFDYVALGHLHSPQSAGANAFYSGSPLKYSFDEEHQKKSVLIAEFNGSKKEVRKIPVPPVRDVKTLCGKFDELIKQGEENPDDSYIYVTLTDDYPVYMPVDRLRKYYPNILGLKSEFLSRKATSDKAGIKRTSTDREIFSQFLKQMCACEQPDENDVNLLMEILKEIKEVQ
ncbi:MAG: exonuclease SbcCD subunit D [Acutalibacteraceae bacterium]